MSRDIAQICIREHTVRDQIIMLNESNHSENYRSMQKEGVHKAGNYDSYKFKCSRFMTIFGAMSLSLQHFRHALCSRKSTNFNEQSGIFTKKSAKRSIFSVFFELRTFLVATFSQNGKLSSIFIQNLLPNSKKLNPAYAHDANPLNSIN